MKRMQRDRLANLQHHTNAVQANVMRHSQASTTAHQEDDTTPEIVTQSAIRWQAHQMKIGACRPNGPTLCQPGATPQELEGCEEQSPNGAALS